MIFTRNICAVVIELNDTIISAFASDDSTIEKLDAPSKDCLVKESLRTSSCGVIVSPYLYERKSCQLEGIL